MTLNYDKIAQEAAERGSAMAPASDTEDAHTEYEASLNQESEQTPELTELPKTKAAMYEFTDASEALISLAESLERIANAVERLVSDVKRREGEL